ncbi:MAG: nucleotidyltransferase family protein, partial [Pseudomonadota bacterium]
QLWNRLVVVECTDAELGMGHSLAGVTALPRDSEACLICLGDMPWIRPDTYRRLLDTLDRDGIRIPEYQGRPGHPVGFGQRFFDELRRCRGDRGAREVLLRHRADCERLSVEDEGILQDVDTPADMREHDIS